MGKRTFELNEMDVKQSIKIMMAESNVESISELARRLDLPQTTLRTAINNNTIRLSVFIKAAETMGYTLAVHPKQ